MSAGLYELVEAWQDAKGYNFEGDSGMTRLETFFEDLGYEGHGFRFGTPIEHFLSDNPGAVEALLSWVQDQRVSEWADSLRDAVEEAGGELPEEEDE